MPHRAASRSARPASFLLVVLVALLTFTGTARAVACTDPNPDSHEMSVANAAVTEGTGAAVQAHFVVSISTASTCDVTVNFATNSGPNVGSATPAADYTTASGTATIPAGELSVPVDVAVVGDTLDEDEETFQLGLSAVTNAKIVDASGIATITDDDPPPKISVADASVTEGTGANRFLIFTVSLSAASGKFVTVNYATAPGTASVPAVSPGTSLGDFQPRDGTLTFSPGLTAQTKEITIVADTADEIDETLNLNLSLTAQSNATLDRASAVGTIIDDDGPSVAINDVAVTEGAADTTATAAFTVTLSAVSPQDVQVAYASSNDTAIAGQDYDALPANQVLTIPAGQLTGTIVTTVRGDDLNESDEKYRVTLSSPVDATLGDPIGVVTISNDDATPDVTVEGTTIKEGTGGSTVATLTVKLSAASGKTLLAGYATKDDTAKAGVDYQQSAELLTFNPGERSKTISIPIAPDAEVEEDEAFQVFVFNASSGANSVQPVVVTITDDDLTDANSPRISVDDVTVREGDSGSTPAVFTISLDRPLARRVTVRYATVNGSATSPADYLPASGVLSFAAGERTKTVTVTTLGDTLLEFGQDYRLQLSDPVNAKLGDGSGLGIVTDDDAGGGLLTVGQGSVKAADLLCLKRKKCAGLLVRWLLANPGSVTVDVQALIPAAKAPKGKRPAAAPRANAAPPKAKKATPPFRLLRATVKVPKAGAGTARAKRAADKATTKLLRRVRSLKVATVRVTVTFTNRFGGQQTSVGDIALKP